MPYCPQLREQSVFWSTNATLLHAAQLYIGSHMLHPRKDSWLFSTSIAFEDLFTKSFLHFRDIRDIYPWYIGQVENSWAFVPTSILSQVNIKLWSDKSEIHQISQMFSICAPNYYLLDSTLTQILFIHTHTFLWYSCSSINRRMLWVPRWS